MVAIPVRSTLILWVFCLLIWIPCCVFGEKPPVSVTITGEKAEATYLKGSAFQVEKGMPSNIALKKGDFLEQGKRFYTDKASKLELKLPDNSYIRFDEQTTFELTSVGYNGQQQQRTIHVNMVLGNTWANVSKLFGQHRSFQIATKTAVMGVRGTVYRVNVQKDDTVIVKVYWGEILINSKPLAGMPQPSGKLTKPSKVSGPEPIEGPKPVSMEDWTYIVKSMQQMIIRPDGTTTKPFRFSPEEDLDDWVRWNQQRDAQLKSEQE